MAASTTATTSTSTSATHDDRPPSPARRRRHRDSIAMNFRPPTKELYHTASLTDHIPYTEQQRNDSLRDLQAMLHDVADWDAKQEEQQQNTTASTPAQKESPKQAAEQRATKTTTVTTSTVGSRSVRFHQAVFHYHPRIIGDNPACTSGVPLSIDWKALHTVTRDLTTNEEEKERTPLTALYLSPQERRSICQRELGLSLRVIHQACKPVNIARSQRRRTLEMLPFAPLHEQLERIQRKLVCQSSNSNTSAVASYWEQQQQQQSSSSSSQQTASFLRRSSSNKSSSLSTAAAAVHSNTQKNSSSSAGAAAANLDHTQSTVLLDDSSGASASQHSPRVRTSVHEAADLRFSRQPEEEAEA